MDRRPTTRTSLACQPCRDQHLKCDAAQPCCSRCQRLSRVCSYPESRRTGKYRAACRITSKTTPESPLGTVPPAQSSRHFLGESNYLRSSTSDSSRTPSVVLDTDTFLSSYYEHFHCSHPFVLPRTALEDAVITEAPSVLQLINVMRYLGSFYLGEPTDLPVAPDTSDLVDGFSVQTLLLLSLVRSMCSEQDQADELLAKAIYQGKSIGLHTKDFADTTELYDPVLAESWRRTWWMLYITHLNYAVIRQDYTTTLKGADYNVSLPCEDEDYFSLNPPSARTSMRDYNGREFALEETHFSSFAYFINATEIFVTALGDAFKFDDAVKAESLVENLEASIAAWYIMLPPDKREVAKKPGSHLDQLMFQAHMMMFTSIAYIHRPLSTLGYDPAEDLSSCGSPPRPVASRAAGNLDRQVHLEKLLLAVRNQNQALVSLPLGSALLSPFTICMVACCTIAHLVAHKSVLPPSEAHVARSRIRVCIGTLQHYADMWPRAKKVLRELRSIARVLLQDDLTIATQPLSISVDMTTRQQQSTPVTLPNMDWLCAFDSNLNQGSVGFDGWTEGQTDG